MNLNLVQQTHNLYQNNLSHCKDFKQSDLKMTEDAKKMWIGRDVARLPAVYFFNKYIKEINLYSNKLLTFGGINDIEVNLLPHKEWVDSDFWVDKRNDVEDLSLSPLDKNFDFIIINQTFEHLTSIESAISNIRDRLVSGGYVYANFPVLNIPHGHPFCFFTGIAVQYIIYLCLKYKFEIIRSGEWGNLSYIEHVYQTLTWPDYTQIGLDNDPARPCIGWVLAKKYN